MTALRVVVADVLDDRWAGLFSSREVPVVHALDLQGAVDRFRRRVVPAVALAAHRHRDARVASLARYSFAAYCDPRSRWCSKPGSGSCHPSATSSARAVSSCGIVSLIARPTSFLPYRSSTSARHSQPLSVGTYVMAASHFWFGAVASKSHSRAFGATGCACDRPSRFDHLLHRRVAKFRACSSDPVLT